MSAQNGEQEYSHETVHNQVNPPPKVGGPPVQSLVPLLEGCTGANPELFNQVQAAVDCACIELGSEHASLCRATRAGDIFASEPFDCLVKVIEDQAGCDHQFNDATTKQAYQTFIDITGIQPINMNQVFTNLQNETKAVINFNAFYVFIPILILILIGIWLIVAFGWINWALGLFITTFVFVFLYGFSILYRITAQNYLRGRGKSLQNMATEAQENFQNGIAYLPQALFSVACADVAEGGTGYWTCNEVPCVGSARVQSRGCKGSRCRGIVNEEYDEEDETPRRRRVQRRRRRND